MKNKSLFQTKYQPESDSFVVFLQKIIQNSHLIWVFAKRDISVKYAQTSLGYFWALLQPLVALVIYTVFFGFVLNWESDNIPFPIYVLTGLLGWNLFSYIVNVGTLSFFDGGNLMKKIYFPKIILPFSKVIIGLVDLLIGLLLLIPLFIYYDLSISWKVIVIPVVMLLTAMCGLTLVFWLTIFSYKKRDVLHVIPFIINYGIWLTPVFFSATILPVKLRFILDFNPMNSIINCWRWTLFDSVHFQLNWLYSLAGMIVFFIFGLYFFNKAANKIADYI
ncbi:MAG: ABC transporter permease [Fluviicola sp.]|nr:ABC transporter permease [Fluviicola sp.]MBP6271308.1 ABC transporter permease [Fluviicola sp.]